MARDLQSQQTANCDRQMLRLALERLSSAATGPKLAKVLRSYGALLFHS